jgi:hypothetical protein
MAQKARPNADVSTGGFTLTPVFEKINELVHDDGTLVSSDAEAEGDAFRVKLPAMAWPSPGDQVLTVRLRKTENGNLPATIKLWQGTTLIAWRRQEPTLSFGNVAVTLTDEEKALLSNYKNLEVEVVIGNTIEVNCATNKVADILLATVTNKTGECTCMPDTLPLVYNPDDQHWTSAVYSDCQADCEMNLECLAGKWNMGTASCDTCGEPVSINDDPFELVFDCVAADQCTGTYRVTVTEMP